MLDKKPKAMGLLVVALTVAYLAMSVAMAGQVPIGYVRQAMIGQDPMVAAESRASTRSISWIEFSKAAARSPPPLPQERAQWRQPPLASINGPAINNNDNHHPSARVKQRQQWPQPHAKWDDEFLPAQPHHSAGSAPEHDRFRYQHGPLYRSNAAAGAVALRSLTPGGQMDQSPPSARRSSPVVTLSQPPVIVVQSDELTDEYDSSELFEYDQMEFSDDENLSVAKSDVDPTVLNGDDEETDPMEDDPLVITAQPRPNTGPGRSSAELTESSSKEWPASQENQASSEQPQGAVWQRYPQLLAPPTPPGKRVITAENHAPTAPAPKPSRNHRISYGLTAASYYARLQPSLKLKNGTGLRQRVISRPYRRRPTSRTTTTAKPQVELTVETSPEFNPEPNPEVDHEAEPETIDATRELEVMPSAEEIAEDEVDYVPGVSGFKSHDLLDPSAAEENDDNDEIQSAAIGNEHEETNEEETVPLVTLRRSTMSSTSTTSSSTTTSTMTSTTTSSTTTTPKPSAQTPQHSNSQPSPINGPVDIKELLRNAGPLSLSEILQQRGMSLAELLKGNGGNRIAPAIAPNGAPNGQAVGAKSEPTTTTTTTTTTTDATTPARPDVLPSVKPISLKELLAAKNMSIADILKPGNDAVKTVIPTELPSPTLKPGVKRPMPFSPGRAKGLAGLVAPAAPPETAEQNRPQKENQEPLIKPVEQQPTIQLKPLIFGGAGTVDEALSSTTTTATSRLVPVQTKRPYVPGTLIGQYGIHMGRSYEEDEDEDDSSQKSIFSGMVGSYGNQRPIAISRLTPAPPRKSRPVLNFNYNELSEEGEEEGEQPSDTTVMPILTHFNEEELKEDHPYFDLPLSVRSAIIASSAVGGFCLLVFMVILTVFMVKQKTRIRLRHPTALFGMSTTALTPSNGSESSGITTPVSQPTTKGGYAKLPQRSSSLWGTLRRSVRQINSVHYS